MSFNTELATDHYDKAAFALEAASDLMTLPIHRFWLTLTSAIVHALWAIFWRLP